MNTAANDTDFLAALFAGETRSAAEIEADMEAARALYTDLGFAEIPPYYHNPLPGSHYLKVDII